LVRIVRKLLLHIALGRDRVARVVLHRIAWSVGIHGRFSFRNQESWRRGIRIIIVLLIIKYQGG
jgi:hypothetical protein